MNEKNKKDDVKPDISSVPDPGPRNIWQFIVQNEQTAGKWFGRIGILGALTWWVGDSDVRKLVAEVANRGWSEVEPGINWTLNTIRKFASALTTAIILFSTFGAMVLYTASAESDWGTKWLKISIYCIVLLGFMGHFAAVWFGRLFLAGALYGVSKTAEDDKLKSLGPISLFRYLLSTPRSAIPEGWMVAWEFARHVGMTMTHFVCSAMFVALVPFHRVPEMLYLSPLQVFSFIGLNLFWKPDLRIKPADDPRYNERDATWRFYLLGNLIFLIAQVVVCMVPEVLAPLLMDWRDPSSLPWRILYLVIILSIIFWMVSKAVQVSSMTNRLGTATTAVTVSSGPSAFSSIGTIIRTTLPIMLLVAFAGTVIYFLFTNGNQSVHALPDYVSRIGHDVARKVRTAGEASADDRIKKVRSSHRTIATEEVAVPAGTGFTSTKIVLNTGDVIEDICLAQPWYQVKNPSGATKPINASGVGPAKLDDPCQTAPEASLITRLVGTTNCRYYQDLKGMTNHGQPRKIEFGFNLPQNPHTNDMVAGIVIVCVRIRRSS